MARRIKKAAVIGSGIMGSRIACHLANIGLEVLLLDIPHPRHEEGVPKDDLVKSALQTAIKSNPSPLYVKSAASRISVGTIDDDLAKIKDYDWVIEAVIENLDIKKGLFEKIDAIRKEGTLITSNTSGIPIEAMVDGRSEDFKAHFCGTHFFNPPRYLKLLEIIPSSYTNKEVVDFLLNYGDLFLGKTTVLAKDTPAFIANRVGVFSIMAIFQLMEKYGLTVQEVDLITGPVTGRPKSATFRTCDLVGIDTLVRVAQGVATYCPNDEMREWYGIPDFLQQMLEKEWLGDKTKQGFYKKMRDEHGNTDIHVLDLKAMSYQKKAKIQVDSIGAAKAMNALPDRLKFLFNAGDDLSKFYKDLSVVIAIYSANRIPEIADHVYQIDQAMKAGFGWELGPFETCDVIGLGNIIEHAETLGLSIPDWLSARAKSGQPFYETTEGNLQFFNLGTSGMELIPGTEDLIILDHFKGNKPVFSNKECSLWDIGDGVLCLEFHSKMNAIGSGILSGINKAVDLAEKDSWRGLVIGNDAPNFSAGANLAMMLMLALDQDFDELNMAIQYFQRTVMRLRYSSIPVVLAPHGLTLGGGCEMSLHADSTLAAAETYIGLVEVGAGLIPGGGGTKEFAVRLSDAYHEGDPQIPALQHRFTTIATAKVATSGQEAFELGYLHTDKDEVVVNGSRLLAEAKAKVLELSSAGYTQKSKREDVLVMGRTALGALYSGIEAFGIGNYASEHDMKIARKVAYVLAGGDLSEATRVTEQYLLDLEREAFLSLLGEKKTLERMKHILTTGKPLRN